MPDTKTNAALQEWYREGRAKGYLKKDPRISGWVAEGVKKGYLRDESGGSVYEEPKKATPPVSPATEKAVRQGARAQIESGDFLSGTNNLSGNFLGATADPSLNAGMEAVAARIPRSTVVKDRPKAKAAKPAPRRAPTPTPKPTASAAPPLLSTPEGIARANAILGGNTAPPKPFLSRLKEAFIRAAGGDPEAEKPYGEAKGLSYPGAATAVTAAAAVGNSARNFAQGATVGGLKRNNAKPGKEGVFANAKDILGDVLDPRYFAENVKAGVKAALTDTGAQLIGEQVPSLAMGTLAGEVYNAATAIGSDPLNLLTAPAKLLSAPVALSRVLGKEAAALAKARAINNTANAGPTIAARLGTAVKNAPKPKAVRPVPAVAPVAVTTAPPVKPTPAAAPKIKPRAITAAPVEEAVPPVARARRVEPTEAKAAEAADAPVAKIKPRAVAEEAAPVLVKPTAPTAAAAPATGVQEARASEIKTDPARFQYKANPKKGSGATGSIAADVPFNQRRAGILDTWVDPENGERYVVNGHNRLEKAASDNDATVLYRDIDAKTAEEARIVGALANIGDGRGTATDAARLFRDKPDITPAVLKADGISLTGKIAGDGIALSKLDPTLWRAVETSAMTEARGAAIGRAMPDDTAKQLALYKMIERQEARGKKVTEATIAELAPAVDLSPVVSSDANGGGLFDDLDPVRESLAFEVAELSAYARREINADANALKTGANADRAARLNTYGNVVDAGKNAVAAKEADTAAVIYDRLSGKSGPVRDALNAAALAIKNGAKPSDVRQSLIGEIRDAVQQTINGNALPGTRRGDSTDSGAASAGAEGGGLDFGGSAPGGSGGNAAGGASSEKPVLIKETVRRARPVKEPVAPQTPDAPINVSATTTADAPRRVGRPNKADTDAGRAEASARASKQDKMEATGDAALKQTLSPEEQTEYARFKELSDKEDRGGRLTEAQEQFLEAKEDRWIDRYAAERRQNQGKTHTVSAPVRELNAPGTKTKGGAARIAVDPLNDGAPMKPQSGIVLDLSKGTGRRVTVDKNLGRGTAGVYYPGTASTRVRFSGDLDTISHEVAHALDDKHNIVGKWATNAAVSPFDGELIPAFSQYGSQPPAGPNALIYQRAEGVAEWVRAYLFNPTAAEAAAPQFAKFFKATVPEADARALRAFSDDVRRYFRDTPGAAMERMKAATQFEPAKPSLAERAAAAGMGRKPKKDTAYRTTTAVALRQKFRSDFAAVQSAVAEAMRRKGIQGGLAFDLLPSNDPEVLARQLRYFNNKADDILNNGMVTATGVRVGRPVQEVFEPLGGLPGNFEDNLREGLAVSQARRVTSEGRRIDKRVGDTLRGWQAMEDKAIAEMVTNGAPKADIDLAQKKADRRMKDRTRRMTRAAENQKGRLRGQGGGVLNDTEDAKKLLADMAASDPAKLKAYQEFGDRLNTLARQTLEYTVAQGRLSPDAFKRITDAQDFYTPLERIVQESPLAPPTPGGNGALGKGRSIARRFKGSTETVESPSVVVLRNLYLSVKEADRNRVLRSIRDLLIEPRGLYEGEVVSLADIGYRVNAPKGKFAKPPEGTIPIYVDGEAEYWRFPDEGVGGLLQTSLQGALLKMGEVNTPSGILAVPRFLRDLVQFTATKTLPFAIRNRVRDAESRALVSRTASLPFSLQDIGDNLKLPTQDEKDLYALMGAGINKAKYLDRAPDFYAVQDRLLKEMGLRKSSKLAWVKKVGEVLERPIEASEKATRIAEMRSASRMAQRAGLDDYNTKLFAADQSAKLQDFTEAGEWSRWLNQNFLPFLTAGIEGKARFAQAMTAKGNRGKFATRAFLASVVPTVAVYEFNRRRGEETLEEAREFPAYVRDYFYMVKAGPDNWIAVPKPHELGVVSSVIERGLDYARTKDVKSLDGWGGSLWRAFAPFDEGALMGGPFASFVEAKANYDSFRDRNIISPFESDLDVSLRRGTREATRLGQAGQKLTAKVGGEKYEQDARVIDFLIGANFGEYGRIAQGVSDVGRPDRVPAPMTKILRRSTGVLRETPGTDSQSTQDALRRAKEAGVSPANKSMVLFNLKRDRMLSATTGEEKDVRARELRRYTKRGLMELEAKLSRSGKMINNKVLNQIMDGEGMQGASIMTRRLVEKELKKRLSALRQKAKD